MMFARRKRAPGEWRPGPDYRIVCPCQHHARQEPWRRAARLASRVVAVLMGVPLALAAFDVPLSEMKLGTTAPMFRAQMRSGKVPPKPRALPIISTQMREQFVSSVAVQRTVSIDAFKEAYFREHVPFGDIIYREARKNGLAPELVAAMVHTESDFRPGLISHKSAQGLMQIVPETARLLGVGNIFDPEQNIAAGTRYLRYLLNRFENERVALAAYNAGEGKVERCGCIPEIAETQQYIEKVNRRANRYRQRVRNNYLAAMRMQSALAH